MADRAVADSRGYSRATTRPGRRVITLVWMASDELTRLQPALNAFFENDSQALEKAILADPGIVHFAARGDTMVELAAQPGIASVSRDVISVLIAAGAHLDRALNLAACWNRADMVRQLLAAGADPAARADADITPLESAAYHGSSDAADALIETGYHRPTLWLAASSGQLDVVKSWFDPDGALLKPPGSYRPNLADVGWPIVTETRDDPAQVRAEALVFAAANGRRGVVSWLIERGVAVDARPHAEITGLHLAIMFRKARMVEHLLALGASTSIHDARYDATPSAWAAKCDDGSDASGTIRQLLSV